MNPSPYAHFQLRVRESVRDGILRIAAALADCPQTLTIPTPANRPKVVHETRLALKRARALVRLLRPSLGTRVADRLNRSLRTAGERLAQARDATAGLQLLDQLRRRHAAEETASLAQVRTRFATSARDQDLSADQLTQGLARATTALQLAVRALTTAPWKKRGWAILAAGLEAGYRRARKRLRAARKSDDIADFHDWRTASKSLLYQLALVRPISKRRLKRWMDELDDLQSALGRLNDTSILAERIARNPGKFGNKAAVECSLGILKREQQRLRKSTVRLGRRILAERSSKFLDRLARDWKAWRK